MELTGTLIDLEEQLQDLFIEVKTLVKLGKKDDAVDLLQANYEAVREQVEAGAQGIEEAAILDVIALGYMAVGDLRPVGSLMDLVYNSLNILFSAFLARLHFHDIEILAHKHDYTTVGCPLYI